MLCRTDTAIEAKVQSPRTHVLVSVIVVEYLREAVEEHRSLVLDI